MTAPKHSVSVTGIVTDSQGRVLVIQRRDNGRWELPGGVLEMDESITAGMQREVMEETGVQTEALNLTGVYKNIKVGVVALVFRARQTGGEPHPTEESAQVEWWTSDEIATRMVEVHAVRALDALRGGEVAIRLHDGVSLLA